MYMNPFIDAKKIEFSESIEHLKKELTRIRTGHANPELLDGITVEAYESLMPLNQVATITAPDQKTLMIAPWDKSLLKQIEKAIVNSNLGYSPVTDGEVVRVPMPPMSEENRKDLAKVINKKAEKYRIAARQLRDKVKEAINRAEKEKEISEDEKFKYLKQLDDYTSERTKEITTLTEQKAEQIMTV